MEDIDDLDYVRQGLDRLPNRKSKPAYHRDGRMAGYAVLGDTAKASRASGTFLRRVFWVLPHDRDSDAEGLYARSAPAEAVDPRTLEPASKDPKPNAPRAARPPGHAGTRYTAPAVTPGPLAGTRRRRAGEGDEPVRGRPGSRGAEGVHPPGTQERARAVRYLIKQLKGTEAVARVLGISQRTVERYVKDQTRKPRPDLAARLEHEVKKRWQPQIRAKARQKAATTGGIVIDTRARIGYTAPAGTTDDARIRHLTVVLPPQYAARLFDAQQAGASDQQLQQIAAEGLQEMYFQDGGRRAGSLEEVRFTGIEHIEFDL